MQKVIAKVRSILTQLQQAIKGEVVMTEELQETLYAVYDAKVSRPTKDVSRYDFVLTRNFRPKHRPNENGFGTRNMLFYVS